MASDRRAQGSSRKPATPGKDHQVEGVLMRPPRVSPVPAVMRQIRELVRPLGDTPDVPVDVHLAVQILLDAADAADRLALRVITPDRSDLVERLVRARAALDGRDADDGSLKYAVYECLVVFSQADLGNEKKVRAERLAAIGRVLCVCVGKAHILRPPPGDAISRALAAIQALPDPLEPTLTTALALNDVLRPLALKAEDDARGLLKTIKRHIRQGRKANS
jgi:hypothetical protein